MFAEFKKCLNLESELFTSNLQFNCQSRKPKPVCCY